MSHLPLGGGSDERTEDNTVVCACCDQIVSSDDPASSRDGAWMHDWCIGLLDSLDEEAVSNERDRAADAMIAEESQDYVLASQRAMDREAVQG